MMPGEENSLKIKINNFTPKTGRCKKNSLNVQGVSFIFPISLLLFSYIFGSQPFWYSRSQSFMPSASRMCPSSGLTLNVLLIREAILE